MALEGVQEAGLQPLLVPQLFCTLLLLPLRRERNLQNGSLAPVLRLRMSLFLIFLSFSIGFWLIQVPLSYKIILFIENLEPLVPLKTRWDDPTCISMSFSLRFLFTSSSSFRSIRSNMDFITCWTTAFLHRWVRARIMKGRKYLGRTSK